MSRFASAMVLVLAGLLTCGLSACDVLDGYILGSSVDPDAGGGGGGGSVSGFRVFTTMDLDGQAADAASTLDMRQVPIIYQHHIDPGNHGVLDAARLRARVLKDVPPNWTGPAILDWEGKWFEGLQAVGTVDHARAVAEGVKALEVARAARPNAKWGYYGLPFRRYWDRENPEWNAWAEGMKPIFDASDILTPSIYDFYEDARDPRGRQSDAAYVRANTLMALKHAQGKPVYPFVWHCWHDSNPKVGGDVIPDDEWAAQIRTISLTEWNGQRAAGVIWWGGDDRAAKQNTLNNRDRIPNGMSQQEYANRLLAHKAAVMAEAIGGPAATSVSPGDPYLGPNPNKKR